MNTVAPLCLMYSILRNRLEYGCLGSLEGQFHCLPPIKMVSSLQPRSSVILLAMGVLNVMITDSGVHSRSWMCL